MKIGINISIGALCLFLWNPPSLAECPSTDVTGDCRVNLEDLAAMAGQWLGGDGIPDDMMAIPGGTFQMGDLFGDHPVGIWSTIKEIPVHTVTLPPFYMSKYEITNAQFCVFLNAARPHVVDGTVYGHFDEGNEYPYFDTWGASSNSFIYFTVDPLGRCLFYVRRKGRSDMSNDPVAEVSWYGAAAYCNWRSQQEGKRPCYNLFTWVCNFEQNGYRLPTEAEWEYAARGGIPDGRFPWGYTISHAQANYHSMGINGPPVYYDVNPAEGYHPIWSQDGIEPYTAPVGSFPPNGYGLYDMAGNVDEWCNDWFSKDYYEVSPNTNPKGPATGIGRVLRSGYWGVSAEGCRVASRGDGYAYMSYVYSGFRLVLGSKIFRD
jgi:formylglycine-generating enzyme